MSTIISPKVNHLYIKNVKPCVHTRFPGVPTRTRAALDLTLAPIDLLDTDRIWAKQQHRNNTTKVQ
jgi:hypothetical protein